MEDTTVSTGDAGHDRAVPIHLWIVGALALLWNAFGGYDYVMTRTKNVDYLASMMPQVDPATTLAYIDSMPLLSSAGWALGVWGGLLGAVLLLMRSRHAVPVFLVSLLGAVVTFGLQFFGPVRPPEALASPTMPIVITLISLGLFLYARTMRQRGVLA